MKSITVSSKLNRMQILAVIEIEWHPP